MNPTATTSRAPLEARALALLFAAVASACAPAPAAEVERPNLLVVVADDLGYGDLGCYGGAAATPALDRLAARGARFTTFYAGAPVCSPSRASLLTGLWAPFTGVRQPVQSTRPGNRLREDLELLPEALRGAGYRTALVGKWHLGWASPDLPTERGFDEFLGFLVQSRYRTERLLENDAVVEREGYLTELITARAVELLERQARDGGAPLFLVVAHLAPHAPLPEAAAFLPEAVAEHVAAGLAPPEAMLRAVVEHLDAEVGELVAALERLDLARSTLVVVVSDNGAQAGSAGALRGSKWGLYEGGLRVPCIVRWPGRVAPGTVAAPAAMPDLYATLLEAAGVAVPATNGGVPLAGRSLLPELAGATAPRDGGEDAGGDDAPRELVWRHGPAEALRRGRWKLVRARDGSRVELYDLVLDPSESTDRAAEHPALVEELVRALDRLLEGA